jgi:phage gpG-like protein
MAASESVKFFKNSFVKGGFTDAFFQKWTDRGSPLGGKKTMYNTGTLMQSIRKAEETGRRVVVVSDTPYSAIHNDGGTITVTRAMKAHFWKLYCEIAGIRKNEKGKTEWGKPHNIKMGKNGSYKVTKSNRKVGRKAEFCKAMALMKVGSKIKMPQQQFIGESQALMTILDRELQTKIAEYWEKA